MTNSESKTPEVGDVWENKFSGGRIIIVGVKGDYYFYGYMKDKIMVIPPFCQNKENLRTNISTALVMMNQLKKNTWDKDLADKIIKQLNDVEKQINEG